MSLFRVGLSVVIVPKLWKAKYNGSSNSQNELQTRKPFQLKFGGWIGRRVQCVGKTGEPVKPAFFFGCFGVFGVFGVFGAFACFCCFLVLLVLLLLLLLLLLLVLVP